MKTDNEIREDVISELEWDPQITDPNAIGAAVQDGAVTLTGHVPTYAERTVHNGWVTLDGEVGYATSGAKSSGWFARSAE